MQYQSFSPRQNATLFWWTKPEHQNRDGLICDGSIRSGKTVSMAIGFIMWSMASFDKQNFAICGRTIEALRRNVIVHIPTWLEGMFEVTERRSENKMVVTIGNRSNTYYLFGGRDESSYTLIQGITLAGVLFDEVALMPRSFVEQAILTNAVRDYTVYMTVDHQTENTAGGSGDASFASHKHAYKGKKAFKVHLGLKAGEQVLLLRTDGGQKFIIIDRVEAPT